LSIRIDLAGDGSFGASRNGYRIHRGIDILAEVDEPIYAPLGGVVINAKFERGYGNYIEIVHKTYNLRTIYAHLSNMIVVKGQFVRQGQIIGFVGKTGNARGQNVLAHLHFEMYQDGKLIDPTPYIE
jgi:murein DD-endopeptidase MepM/ murein hydrolase activator NlpD